MCSLPVLYFEPGLNIFIQDGQYHFLQVIFNFFWVADSLWKSDENYELSRKMFIYTDAKYSRFISLVAHKDGLMC